MFNITSNIDGLIDKFKAIGDKLPAIDPSQALLVGVNAARGQMTFRIFNEGKDSEGISFGIYTGKKEKINTEKTFKKKNKKFLAGEQDQFTEYEQKRIGRGRQIRYKDLEFTGDLRRGIKVIQDSNIRVVLMIPNDELFKISKFQEEQIGKILGRGEVKIFVLSEEERNLSRENTKEALKQIYDSLFNTSKPV